jgi:hypothetical protein
MTEADWLQSCDPQAMLAFLGDPASERKLRLFTCACCRRLSHLAEDDIYLRGAVEGVESYLEGKPFRVEDYPYINNSRMFGADEGLVHAFAHCGMLERAALESALRGARNAVLVLLQRLLLFPKSGGGDVSFGAGSFHGARVANGRGW